MDSATLTSNLIYCTLFILSGIIITVSFRRAKMKIAETLFKILFGVFLIYLPFYFGGSFVLELTPKIIDNEIFNIAFKEFMTQIISTPFLVFKSVSIITAVMAIFVVAGTVLALVTIVSGIISIISKHWHTLKCVDVLTNGFKPLAVTSFYNQRNIYKLTKRFLN